MDGATPDTGSADAATDGTSGPPDAPQNDARVDASRQMDASIASTCEGSLADALLCDDFEDAVEGQLTGALYDDSQAFLGERSLLASVQAVPRPLFGKFYTLEEPEEGTLYARFYLMQRSPFSDRHASIWFQGMDQTVEIITSRSEETGYQITRHAGGGESGSDSLGAPLDQWTCVQVALTHGRGNGALQVSYDGISAVDATGLNVPGGTSRIAVGALTQADSYVGEAMDVRIDELVVDSSPVPCVER